MIKSRTSTSNVPMEGHGTVKAKIIHIQINVNPDKPCFLNPNVSSDKLMVKLATNTETKKFN